MITWERKPTIGTSSAGSADNSPNDVDRRSRLLKTYHWRYIGGPPPFATILARRHFRARKFHGAETSSPTTHLPAKILPRRHFRRFAAHVYHAACTHAARAAECTSCVRQKRTTESMDRDRGVLTVRRIAVFKPRVAHLGGRRRPGHRDPIIVFVGTVNCRSFHRDATPKRFFLTADLTHASRPCVHSTREAPVLPTSFNRSFLKPYRNTAAPPCRKLCGPLRAENASFFAAVSTPASSTSTSRVEVRDFFLSSKIPGELITVIGSVIGSRRFMR